MNIIVTRDYNELSVAAAKRAAEYINNNPDTLVCFAAGDTPLGMFRELVSMQSRGEVNLSSVWYAELDEWAGLGIEDKGSCMQVMTDAFYGPAGIPARRVRLYDGLAADLKEQCRHMEAWIESHGGIGFTLLGIGMNGHIGFNEPGTPFDSSFRIATLSETTRKDKAAFFGGLNQVPRFGISMGIRDIMMARRILLVAKGKSKAEVIHRIVEGPMTTDVPASIVRMHSDLFILADRDAASLL